MPDRIILASQSAIRAEMLRNARVAFETANARVDEEAIRGAMQSEGAHARDIADALAEAKARKVSAKEPDALVIGSDQILDFEGSIFTKPQSPDHAVAQLSALSGQEHKLHSAAVIYRGGEPQWRHVETVRLTMRSLPMSYIQGYVERNWDDIRHTVGCYQIEAEGIRLFTAVTGSHFAVLGMPLLPLLSYLVTRGAIEG